MFTGIDILLAFLLVLVLVITILLVIQMLLKTKKGAPKGTESPMTCGGSTSSSEVAHTCSAIDPVSDPAYNIKQVIKQSILLEEHLTQENKRCKDCILKHLLHITALAEEAAMLAGDRVDRYPYMSDSVLFYNEQLESWLKDPNSVQVQIHIASQLRDWRKKLAAKYFLG